MPREKLVISDFTAQIGARLRVLRYERGLSMRKLAELSGCSAGGIMQIELGRSAFTMKTLDKLAKGLDVQPFDVLNLDTDRDDLGWLVETLRQHPNCVRLAHASIKRP